MKRRFGLILSTACVIAALGCDQAVEPVEVAVNGARPAMDVPIGPVPGPGEYVAEERNPYSNDPIALQEGRKLFVWYNCAGCHGGHAGGGMGPSLRDASWIYGKSDAHIFSSITQGRAHGMPAWGTNVPQDQIWKLAAYVESLGTPSEPSPPE